MRSAVYRAVQRPLPVTLCFYTQLCDAISSCLVVDAYFCLTLTPSTWFWHTSMHCDDLLPLINAALHLPSFPLFICKRKTAANSTS